jgi:phosphate starvation-inducible protein PhoH
MLLVLENNYELWKDAASNRVGHGKYTENARNRKFCGWSDEGIKRFNKLIKEIRVNRGQQYKVMVEKEVCQTLAKRYRKMLGVKHKNSHKRRHHMVTGANIDDEEDEDEDGSNVFPEDELVLWGV